MSDVGLIVSIVVVWRRKLALGFREVLLNMYVQANCWGRQFQPLLITCPAHTSITPSVCKPNTSPSKMQLRCVKLHYIVFWGTSTRAHISQLAKFIIVPTGSDLFYSFVIYIYLLVYYYVTEFKM